MIKFLKSMKFAIALLVILGLVSIIGTLIPQNLDPAYYEQAYSPTLSSLVLTLGWDHLYHSLPYAILTLLLAISLVLCVIARFPQTQKLYQSFTQDRFRGKPLKEISHIDALGPLASQLGENRLVYRKFALGFFGSWLLHLGILLIILSMALGFFFTYEESIYGLPGESIALHKPGYTLTIDDYQVDLRQDHTIASYRTDLTLVTPKESISGTTEVNAPFRGAGINIYQSSTGYTMDVTASKEGKKVKGTLYQGQQALDLGDYQLRMLAFYPDFYLDPQRGPMTLSPYLIRPAMVYELRKEGKVVDMNLLEPGLDKESLGWVLSGENPRQYTLVTVRKDPWTFLAILGGLTLVLGIVLHFYFVPRRIELIPTERDTYQVYLYTPRQEDVIIASLGLELEKE